MSGRERSVLDGPGFGKGIRELLTFEQRKKIERLGLGAGEGVVDYLNKYVELAKRVRDGDIVDPAEVGRLSDSYRRLRGGRQEVKREGRPPRSVWGVMGVGFDES